jgi:hypothetical protein
MQLNHHASQAWTTGEMKFSGKKNEDGSMQNCHIFTACHCLILNNSLTLAVTNRILSPCSKAGKTVLPNVS